MAAYYNENDKFAAAWLRELIKEGLIADGEVDERDIRDVRPGDLRGFVQCHFFAGIGGWSYALRLAGWPDDRPVWTGSCPCQPFSAAGSRGGFVDERHLWPHFFHLVKYGKRPSVPIFGEQVASKDGLAWLDLVSSDLEGEGYTVWAADLCGAGFGSPDIRQRLWFVAHPPSQLDNGAGNAGEGWRGEFADGCVVGNLPGPEERVGGAGFWFECEWIPCIDGKTRPVEPGTFPLAHGVPARVGRLRGYGNAIKPPVAAEFVKAYVETIEGR